MNTSYTHHYSKSWKVQNTKFAIKHKIRTFKNLNNKKKKEAHGRRT